MCIRDRTQPHDVNKVPIPSSRFEGEVMLRIEVPAHRAEQNDRQHDGTNCNVEAVKAGQHVERRTENAGSHFQVEVAVGVHVFVDLQAEEQETECDGRGQPDNELAPLIFEQCVVCNRQRNA